MQLCSDAINRLAEILGVSLFRGPINGKDGPCYLLLLPPSRRKTRRMGLQVRQQCVRGEGGVGLIDIAHPISALIHLFNFDLLTLRPMDNRNPMATEHDGTVEQETSIEPPPKRQRTQRRILHKKAAVACEACQKRKSRCEVFRSSRRICHRCEVLGTGCSLQSLTDIATEVLAQDNSTQNSDVAGVSQVGLPPVSVGDSIGAPQDNSDDVKTMMLRIDQRTSEVERIMRRLLDNAAGFGPPTPLSSGDMFCDREDGIGDGDDIEQTVQEMLQTSIGTSLLAVSGLNLHDRTRFLDPVTSGLLSESRFHDVYVQ